MCLVLAQSGYNRPMARLFSDTSQAVEDELLARLRKAPPRHKLAMVAELSAAVRQLMLAGERGRNPDVSSGRELARLLYGSQLAGRFDIPLEEASMTTPQPITLMLSVAGILERLGVPYVVGGSMASSLHGVGRSTIDIDVIAELRADHVTPLLGALGDEFYADEPAIRAAIEQWGSFNVIHLATLFKVDIFVAGPRTFDRLQLQRRVRVNVSDDRAAAVYLLSPEDIVLAKLDWFRQGGEVSDRQWQDVLGILVMQRDRLDEAYMRHSAIELGVTDLLEKALTENRKP